MPANRIDITRRAVIAGLGAATMMPRAVANARGAIALRRGFNMPGAANADPPKYNAYPRSLIVQLRAAGFDHVRLPIDPARYSSDSDASRELRHLGGRIDDLLRLDFNVIIEMHPRAGMKREFIRSRRETERLLADAWARLSRFIAGLPSDRMAAELLNEPPMAPREWRRFSRNLTRQLRDVLPEHTLIWGAAQWQNHIETLRQMPPSSDLVVAVHYYDPMLFTHQCQSWGGNHARGPLKGVRFPVHREHSALVRLRGELKARGETAALKLLDKETKKPTTVATIEADFAALAAWSLRTGHRIIINEFGVLRHCAPRADRLAWTETVRRACESNGFGWTHWELTRGFGLDARKTSANLLDWELVKRLVPEGAASQ